MSKGRPNIGSEHAMNTDADRVTQERLKAILDTIIGVISVKEACAQIMLSITRFKQIRAIALQAAAEALALHAPGTPENHRRARRGEARAATKGSKSSNENWKSSESSPTWPRSFLNADPQFGKRRVRKKAVQVR
jgi:hypothetical protein